MFWPPGLVARGKDNGWTKAFAPWMTGVLP
jgi:hypothetical protein